LAMCTIVNDLDSSIHAYLTMGAVHHYCNSLLPGQAFTVYPGSFWYTVNFRLDNGTNEITTLEVAGSVAICVGAPIAALYVGPVAAVLGAVGIASSPSVMVEGVAFDPNKASISGVYCGGNPHKTFEVTLGDDKVPLLWAIEQDSPKLRNAKCYRKKTVSGETEPQIWTVHDGLEYPPTVFGWGETKWIEDGDVESCSACKEAFTIFFRRHHCRSCGKIFCWKCSDYKLACVPDSVDLVRVCQTCFEAGGKKSRTVVDTDASSCLSTHTETPIPVSDRLVSTAASAVALLTTRTPDTKKAADKSELEEEYETGL